MTSILKVSEIQDPTNSNTALTIDSSGRVTMAQLPYVAVDMSGSGAYESVAGGAIFPFDNVYEGDSSLWDTTNYEFTCPVAGIYLMTFIGLTQTAIDMAIDFQKNDSTFIKLFATSERGLQGSHMVKCAANDTLRYNHQGSTQVYFNGQTTSRYTSATIALLG